MSSGMIRIALALCLLLFRDSSQNLMKPAFHSQKGRRRRLLEEGSPKTLSGIRPKSKNSHLLALILARVSEFLLLNRPTKSGNQKT
jgi:hypothetical protein